MSLLGVFTITFLGTSSGGGPSESRNCSSLVCDLKLLTESLWMVDCAEGTGRQFAMQPRNSTRLNANKVTKIFITHMHADHIMGIVPFLRNILRPPQPDSSAGPAAVNPPKIEIYGPAGIRNFVRQIMKMTLTRSSDSYTVHELLTAEDTSTPCLGPDQNGDLNVPDQHLMHVNEVAGTDIICTEDSFWKSFTNAQGSYGEVVVDAGPIAHRDPCLGYIFRETSGPQRKLVILGDTFDPSAIIPLCVFPPPSLLVHEATDAHIPTHVDYKSNRTPDTVLAKVLFRGHSMPSMAGDFAKLIGAKRLVLNHISPRFPAPRGDKDYHRIAVMSEIERQATEAWGRGTPAVAAYDYFTVFIPPIDADATGTDARAFVPGFGRDSTYLSTSGAGIVSSRDIGPSPIANIGVYTSTSTSSMTMMDVHHANPSEGFVYVNQMGNHPHKKWRY